MTVKYGAKDENGEIVYRSPFWKQVRMAPELDSRLGYKLTDIDGIWRNGDKCIILEHKCRGQMPHVSQTYTLLMLKRAMEMAYPKTFKGVYLIVHSGEHLDDGFTRLFKMDEHGEWAVMKDDKGFPRDLDKNDVIQFLKMVVL